MAPSSGRFNHCSVKEAVSGYVRNFNELTCFQIHLSFMNLPRKNNMHLKRKKTVA